MLTKKDIETIGKVIDNRLEALLKDIIELFNITNERIDKLTEKLSNANARTDKVLDKLSEHQVDINDHERRIEKIEEKTTHLPL